ncbi:Uncharacterised protein [Yersinia frederiksenii]|nr:Uncharacterised protein [Yersinia frederiksenii]
MATFVTQPQTGDFLLAGQGINVLRFPQTVMQSGDKHSVSRSQVGTVSPAFRALRHWAYLC